MTDFNPNPHPPVGATNLNAPVPGAPTPDTGAGKFDEAYVHELREESAKYRTQYAPYRDAFEPYTEEERAEWLDLAQTLAKDPAAAAERFRAIADSIAPSTLPEPVAPVVPIPGQVDPLDSPMTMRQFQELTQKQQAEWVQQSQVQEQERLIQQNYDVASQLGYKSGTREIVNLLWTARNDPRAEGDLQKAHQILEGEKVEVVRQYLGQKAEGRINVPVPTGIGHAPSNATPPKTFAEARASLDARIDALG